ncbi:hypothetical protein [Amycolatopsis sp. NBC_01480]|uniref:hypothetical protein n=1 Tax=Amycolatopsis sp. NBC_01480 TaxID=2903562 RepID=UPI002E28467C|nr:hypothetical protein [Amycolatopsis sp. NBC_01480]
MWDEMDRRSAQEADPLGVGRTAVAGFIAWGLIAGDFRWAWVSFAVFYFIRIESFVYLNRREKKRRAPGDNL